jgi:serine/threonine-protein kinase
MCHRQGSRYRQRVAATRDDWELDERRRTLRRLLGAGVVAWTAFAASDLFASIFIAHGRHLAWLLGFRAAGTLIAAACYLAVARPDVSKRVLDAVEVAVFVAAGVLLSLMAIPFGGIVSPLIQGVSVVALVRAILPSHGRRTLVSAGLTALSFPVVMAVAAALLPPIEAQWRSRETFLAFCNNYLFVLLGTAIGAYAGHMQWRLRRELGKARRLGSYRLTMQMARGVRGELWLARQESLGRDVVLKLLHESGANDPEAVRRFEREAKAASLLSHPNTIKIFDFGASDDGVQYIAMELLGGLDVASLVVAAGPMPAARAIYLARQACASLAEAHDRGIVHRDVRPDNLFVTQVADDQDFLKVLDFGVARTSARDLGGQDGRALRGTPGYVAPEQIVGAQVDPRTDIYSLGAVLYFMVTGTSPFHGLAPGDALSAHLSKEPPTPSERLGRRVPYDLEQTIARCMAKKPIERYPNARELDAALEACADHGRWSKDEARDFWASLRPSMRASAALKTA